jgi:hypothetical protein
MKNNFLTIAFMGLALNSYCQFQFLGSGGSNAEFEIEYLGSNIVVSAHNNVLEFFDISNPANPQLVNSLNLPPTFPVSIHFSGTNIYAQGYENLSSVFAIVDVSNINAPYVKGTCNWGNYTGFDINTSGNYAYVLSNDSLFVYDCTIQTSPVFLAVYDFPGTAKGKIVIKNSSLILGLPSGMHIYTINANGTLAMDSVVTSVRGGV